MSDKKLTDNEIVKALECCAITAKCRQECIFHKYGEEYDVQNCTTHLAQATLELVNRLQAENERLKSDVSVSKDAYMSMKDRYEYEKEKVEKAKQKCIDIGKALKNAKTEAYKECIEKVKDEKFKTSVDAYTDAYILGEDDLDNLLKELVGDE